MVCAYSPKKSIEELNEDTVQMHILEKLNKY